MSNELVKEIEEAEDFVNKLEDYIRASVAGYSSPKGIAMLSPVRATLQRAREALTWRERAICFMASSLLEQAETREPVIGAKGDMVFKTLGILAARNFEEAKAPVYFETIADTLTEIARAYTPEEK